MKEIRLFDGSRITFERLDNGALSIQLWKCGNWRDGHGLMLSGGAILDGNDLELFLEAILPPPAAEEEEAAA